MTTERPNKDTYRKVFRMYPKQLAFYRYQVKVDCLNGVCPLTHFYLCPQPMGQTLSPPSHNYIVVPN